VPYGSRLQDLLHVEDNMVKRRLLGQSQLQQGDVLLSLTNFPRLGSDPCCTDPEHLPTPDSGPSRSLFLPNETINTHARFPTLTANIRTRRGSKVAINLPIFKDTKTPSPFLEDLPKSIRDRYPPGTKLPDVVEDALPGHVYMDCMCFGMGCCCLQVTFQACSVEEARRLYDQLAVIAPIMVNFFWFMLVRWNWGYSLIYIARVDGGGAYF
jgi:glutamate--cysteine ligase catalytic subunit